MKKSIGRRTFLKSGLAGGAALALAPHARVLGANDDLRVATVGLRSQGGYHVKCLRQLPGVRVVAVCDPDSDVLAREVKNAAKLEQKIDTYTDVRKLLEDKNIDAITTATPDHWHALVTIWACQAGKDVYCEKPLCHSLWEGRKMIEAAAKYDRIVAFGNQNHGKRTGPMRLEDPKLGKIRVAWASLNRGRKSIGKVAGPQTPPKSLDYNLWTGPAPLGPLMRKNLHYDWHWVWPTGTAETGNNGVYPLDALRLALGQNTLPRRVMSLGGRFLFGDDATTPNSLLTIFQYEPGPMVLFELRNLPSKEGPKTLPSRVKWERGTSGYPSVPGKSGETGGHKAHTGHLFNFLSTVRSRKKEELRADMLEGHLSTALVHMANTAYRMGTPQSIGAAKEAVQPRGEEAVAMLAGFQAHLEANGVDFAKTKMIVSPWLEMDAKKEQFVGDEELAGKANQLVRRKYREPFVIRDEV